MRELLTKLTPLLFGLLFSIQIGFAKSTPPSSPFEVAPTIPDTKTGSSGEKTNERADITIKGQVRSNEFYSPMCNS